MRGVAFVALSKGLFALIDSADRKAVGKHKWQVKLRPRGTAYAVTTMRGIDGGRRMVSLHRFVWWQHGGAETPIVDHKNGWGLDCRWTNLRGAGHDQNAWNASVHRDAASGIKGVSWDKRRRRWRARVSHHGRRVCIAMCKRKRDAVKAYRSAVRALHGEFARATA